MKKPVIRFRDGMWGCYGSKSGVGICTGYGFTIEGAWYAYTLCGRSF